MSTKKGQKNNCGIATALSILGDKWTLLIARDIMMGNQNFEAIQNSLNISRNLLTERLKYMINEKLIRRYVPNNKKRAMYVPTERCNDLARVFLSLSLWADRWVPDPKRPKIVGMIDEKVTEIGLKVIPLSKEEDNKDLSKELKNYTYALLILYFVLLFFGGKLFLDNSLKLFALINMPELIIGILVLAIGTSLPELATIISSYRRKAEGIGIGNIIGSNIANFTIFSIINLLFVIPLPSFAMSSLILILIAEIILFSFILIFSRRKSVPNYCGIFLLLLYIIFVFKV